MCMSCAIWYYKHTEKKQSVPKVSSQCFCVCFKGHELEFGSMAGRRMWSPSSFKKKNDVSNQKAEIKLCHQNPHFEKQDCCWTASLLLNLNFKLRGKSLKQKPALVCVCTAQFLHFADTAWKPRQAMLLSRREFGHFWRRLQLSARTRHCKPFVIFENLISLHFK